MKNTYNVSRLQEELAKRLEERKVNIEVLEETESKEIELKKENKVIQNLYLNDELSFVDKILDGDEDIEFVKSRTKTILGMNTLNIVVIGTLLEEIYDKIGNKKNGEFYQYLKEIGMNEKTALRYRKKASLFNKVENENGKKVVMSLGHEDIEKIIQNEEFEKEIIEHLNRGADKKVIKLFINENMEQLEYKKKEEVIEETKEFNLHSLTTQINDRWNNLEKRKQNRVKNLFNKIIKIMNEE